MVAYDFGKHILVGIAAPTLSREHRELLERVRPLGVLLRKEAILQGAPFPEWHKALSSLIHSIKVATRREKLVVSVDHEGGRVNRFPKPVTKFPYPIFFREQSKAVGKAMGEELCSLGVNFVLSPVVDIHSNEQNPVIGPRAFGRTAEEVSRFASEFSLGLKESKIACCAKHFPGHGDTLEDSHFSLPAISYALPELKARELKPFETLIASGVQAVMSGHLMISELDSQYPASLSEKVIKSLLREQLGFSGVVLADDLDMKAVCDRYSISELALAGMTSTTDLFIFYHFPERAEEFFAALGELLENGSLSESLFTESHKRIDSFVKQLLPNEIKNPDSAIFEQHHPLAQSILVTNEFDSLSHHYQPK